MNRRMRLILAAVVFYVPGCGDDGFAAGSEALGSTTQAACYSDDPDVLVAYPSTWLGTVSATSGLVTSSYDRADCADTWTFQVGGADIAHCYGQTFRWGGNWAGSLPSSQAACESATEVVSGYGFRQSDSTWVSLGAVTRVGDWLDGSCHLDYSGGFVTSPITNSPYRFVRIGVKASYNAGSGYGYAWLQDQ